MVIVTGGSNDGFDTDNYNVTVSPAISTIVPCQHDKVKNHMGFSPLVRCNNQLDVPECSVFYSCAPQVFEKLRFWQKAKELLSLHFERLTQAKLQHVQSLISEKLTH